ncbi:unnamed protein product [Polarella glacialis]|uniref:Protein C10 n=1 Tax=Polarella glacialis TaxID=89957 RepID=A0A813G0I9_POLGL|nr:unnamed protein product [Polarella glacialis]
METSESRKILHDMRNTCDMEGPKGAERLFEEWNLQNVSNHARELQKQKLEGPTVVASMQELQDALAIAAKCKKDGLVEWERGNHEEALKSWREGSEALGRLIPPNKKLHPQESKSFAELHIALLKNQAQAAIKSCLWNEALESAQMALKIDDQDHKAWFRKACALEGLGRLDEVAACFDMIDTIAVGRPDRDRLQQDTSSKREKLRELRDREEASQRRMLQLGIEKSLFSEARDADTSAKGPDTLKGPPRPEAISHKLAVASVDEESRKRLTRDGAEDLLIQLAEAYRDPSFRQQVRKLARDVADQAEFICYLNKVALPVQGPVLEKWGFEATLLGVAEMRRAIQDHTLGQFADPGLKRQAEETMQALYGELYDTVRGQGLRPEDRAERAEVSSRRMGSRATGMDAQSDSEGEPEVVSNSLCAHWTGRPTATDEHRWRQKPDRRPFRIRQESLERKRGANVANVGTAGISVPGSGDGCLDVLNKTTVEDSVKKPSAAALRKQIWADLNKTQAEGNAKGLRLALERAIAAGFSEVTVRSSKKALAALGGNLDHL